MPSADRDACPAACLQKRVRVAILLLAALATVLKAIWAFNSVGSFDAAMFYNFAKALQATSLAEFYRARLDFNHTPFTATLIRGLYALVQGDYRLFAGLFRSLAILADLAVILAVLRVAPRLPPRVPVWALDAFAVSPVSIVLSGFHGNVDPLLTAALFLSAVAAFGGRPIGCGALLALAANFKIVPILLIPVFLAFWLARGRRPLLEFTGMLTLGLALGYGPTLISDGPLLLRNVFGYGGYWGTWGIPYLLRLSGRPEFSVIAFVGIPQAAAWVMLALKWITVTTMLWLAWRQWKLPPAALFHSLALAFAAIYTFAPGGATQYMAWFGPFLLLAAPRWWAAATAAATVFLFAFYHASAHGPFPWFVVFPKTGEEQQWIPWTLAPWLTFASFLLCQLRPQKSSPDQAYPS